MRDKLNVSFNKSISTFSLLMTGVTAIVGSGWLLGTQKIAEIAGPAGLVSWLIGAVVAMLVALFYLEIGTAYPSAGGIGYYSSITHGRFCGFLTSWINWLSVVAVPPIEAQAIIQYLSNLPGLTFLYTPALHALTLPGIICAVALMAVFMFINYWSVQFFIRFNNVFTIIKMVVPLLTIAMLTYQGLHLENFTHGPGGFLPFGWHAVFGSVITCGVVMAFNGFQSPLTFSEEISNPRRMLPIAVLGCIVIAFVLYVLLQIVFVGSLSPAVLAKGWQTINFRSPYVDLLLMANFHLVVLSIYVGAVISPGACGSGFLASSARVMYSLARHQHLPKFLSFLNPEHQSPRNAVMACTLVGCVILFIFKGWYDLVAVISILHVFSYIPAPIIALANRQQNPQVHQKQFVLPFAKFLSPILLFILSLLLFYAAWPFTGEMILLVVPGLCFYFYYELRLHKLEGFLAQLRCASWLIIYLIGITLISFLGQNHHRAENILSSDVSMVLMAILSIVVSWYGVYVAMPRKKHA
jgi:amino acid transporter